MSIQRLALCLVIVSMAPWFLTSPARAAEPVIVNDTYWPPFFFGERQGSPPGFAREVLERCVPAAHRPDFEVFPVSRMWAFIERGVIDINVMSFSEDRLSLVRYGSEPVFRAGYRLVVRADDPRRVTSLADLAGHRVGHLRGLRYSEDYFAYLEKQTEKQLVRTVDSGELLLEALLDEKVDVFANHAATARFQARQLGVEDRIRILDDYDLKSADYFAVVSLASPRLPGEKAQRDFLAAIDTCIAAGREQGWFATLESKYGLR